MNIHLIKIGAWRSLTQKAKCWVEAVPARACYNLVRKLVRHTLITTQPFFSKGWSVEQHCRLESGILWKLGVELSGWKKACANMLRVSKAAYVVLATVLWLCSTGTAVGSRENADEEAFKQFVNGRIPVQEAVVYRTISADSGIIKNEEWYRFGYELGNWYVERLQPDPTNKTVLVPRGRKQVYGASSTNLWAVSETDLHLAGRTSATNSIFDNNRAHRNMMFAALSLGVPRVLNVQTVEDSQIAWSGWDFSTFVAPGGGSTKPVAGFVLTNASGLPASAEYRSSDGVITGVVEYEYGEEHPDIPRVFVARYDNSKYRYEFLTLKLGSKVLPKGADFTPAQFANLKHDRNMTVWSNNKPFYILHSNLVFTAIFNPGSNGRVVILSLLLSASAFFLVLLWRVGSSRNKKPKEEQ